MRLDLLLQRENFAQTFEQSLAGYLRNALKVDSKVVWGGESKEGSALLVNHKLNVIYAKNIDRSKLRAIVSEYAYHPNPLRRLLQTNYIRLATCVYFEWLFLKARVSVSPWVEDLDHLCIIPGNHLIRIVNLKTHSCRVMVKPGFDVQFLQNEIFLRERYDFLPIPQLLRADPEFFWYDEVQISALPLNRLERKCCCKLKKVY